MALFLFVGLSFIMYELNADLWMYVTLFILAAVSDSK